MESSNGNFTSLKKKLVSVLTRTLFVLQPVLAVPIFTALFFYALYSDRKRLEREMDIFETFLKKFTRERGLLFTDWIDYESPVLYIRGKYPDYVEKEILTSLDYLNLDFLVSYYPDGKLKEVVFFENGKRAQVPEGILQTIQSLPLPDIKTREDFQYGFIQANGKMYFITITGILWYGDNYSRKHGTFIFGTDFEKFIKDFQYRNLISIDTLSDSQASSQIHKQEQLTDERNQDEGKKFDTGFFLDKSIKMSSLFNHEGILLLGDLNKKPAGTIRILYRNDFLIFYVIGTSFVMVSFFIITFILFSRVRTHIDNLFLNRLHKLYEEIKINQNQLENLLPVTVDENVNDELVLIQSEINKLIFDITQYISINKSIVELVKLEEKKTRSLLENILPEKIIKAFEVIDINKQIIADEYQEASILFCDLVNYTKLSANLTAKEIVRILNDYYSRIDSILDKFRVEKIKTIGDCYMAATGLPEPDEFHADNIIRFAFAILKITREFSETNNLPLQVRIGIHSGRVVGGVIGKKKYIFDIWGETVNIASRLESHGVESHIQISSVTYSFLRDPYLKQLFKRNKRYLVKGGIEVVTYISNHAYPEVLD